MAFHPAPITRSSQLGPAARPVSVPDDMSGPKATGKVTLPPHVYWSGPDPGGQVWDLDDRRRRARLYEIVLREGTVDDVRHYIDLDLLAELWDELFLPEPVRRAWEHRRIDVHRCTFGEGTSTAVDQ